MNITVPINDHQKVKSDAYDITSTFRYLLAESVLHQHNDTIVESVIYTFIIINTVIVPPSNY